MPKAMINEIMFDGYERLYLLDLIESNSKVWAYGLEYDNYVKSGFEFVNKTIEKECSFSIEWVIEIKLVNFDVEEIVQDKLGSPHTVCNVIVTKVINSDSFECFSEGLGTVVVELESDVDFLEVGSKVSFKGNLRVDFI